MSPSPPHAVATDDAVALLRGVLERSHLSRERAIELGDASGGRRTVRFHELRSAALLEPEALERAIVNLLGSLHAADLEFYVWLHGDGVRLRILLGVAPRDAVSRPYLQDLLLHALNGHLLGSAFEPVQTTETERMGATELQAHQACGVILGLPGLRDGSFATASLDGAMESLVGRRFDLVLRASPVPRDELGVAENNLALLSSHAHRLAHQSVSMGDTEAFSRSFQRGASVALAATTTTNWSTTESESTSNTEDTSHEARAAGAALGAILGGVAAFAAGAPHAIGGAVNLGAKLGGDLAGMVSTPTQTTRGRSDQHGGATSAGQTTTVSTAETETVGVTASRQVSFEVVNRQAALLEEIAEQHLERLRAGQALGMWRTSVHVAAPDEAALQVTGNVLIGAVRGDQTHLEPLRLIRYSARSTKAALASLQRMTTPELGGAPHPVVPRGEQLTSLITTSELACWMPWPCHDLPGLPARKIVHLGRGGSARRDRVDAADAVRIGRLVYAGRASDHEPVALSLRDLTGHVFVAGTTGAGKTTTIKTILRRLQALPRPVPFLLLEPAKSEYEDLYAELEAAGKAPVRYALGGPEPSASVRLRFNPFVAPAGLPLGRHVESLKVLLRSCFDMQESLPQILERALFDAYADLGWRDLVQPITAEAIAARGFPSFETFTRARPRTDGTRATPTTLIEQTVASFGYEPRIQQNLVAAMTVRMQSFRRGLKGEVFDRDELDVAAMLQRPCFINLADLTEPDIRRFLLASLFLRIYAEREVARRRGGRDGTGTDHLLVLEEAHHFLREPRSAGPSASLIAQSNQLVADAFAELRAYGQAILVADQAPSDLDSAVIRNTNTKLVHRLLHDRDVEVMAESIGLEPEHRSELRRLRRGECAVFTPSVQHAFVCQVDPAEGAP